MPRVRILSLDDVTRESQKWDELWQRSQSRLPSKRADGLRIWCNSFAENKTLVALVVEEGERFLASIPLIEDRTKGFRNYRLATNCMATAGDLLIDPSCDVNEVTMILAEQIVGLPGTLASFEQIDLHSARWQRMITSLRLLGKQIHVSNGYDVGEVEILHDWPAYTKSWSRNHRSAIKRSRNKLEVAGEVVVERLRAPSDSDLFEALEACFVVEDLGWKGEEGTSILKTPGLRDYLHREARMVRDLGHLDLWMLRLDGQLIAFEYCHFAEGICFSHIISFDPAFSRFSPSRVLRSMQLQQYHEDPTAVSLNTLGVLCSAKAKWCTRSYRSSRLFVATSNPLSNPLFRLLKTARWMVKRLRNQSLNHDSIVLGAASYPEIADPSQPSLMKRRAATPQSATIQASRSGHAGG